MLGWRHRQNFLTLSCFSCQVQLLVQVSCEYHLWYWSYDNFFHKELTRNPEIENFSVWILASIWRLGWVRDTKFSTSVCNEMLINTAKCQGCSFYRFWVIKRKPQGVKLTHRTPRLGLNQLYLKKYWWVNLNFGMQVKIQQM